MVARGVAGGYTALAERQGLPERAFPLTDTDELEITRACIEWNRRCRARPSPGVQKPAQALRIATVGGADAWGLDAGRLVPGP